MIPWREDAQPCALDRLVRGLNGGLDGGLTTRSVIWKPRGSEDAHLCSLVGATKADVATARHPQSFEANCLLVGTIAGLTTLQDTNW